MIRSVEVRNVNSLKHRRLLVRGESSNNGDPLFHPNDESYKKRYVQAKHPAGP